MDSLKAVSQGIIASAREPGDKMVRTLEKTTEKYACALYTKRMLKLEEVQVLPEIVTHGKEINQRIQYAFCPFTPSETLKVGCLKMATEAQFCCPGFGPR